jgi:S1-C subfamily serine protease
MHTGVKALLLTVLIASLILWAPPAARADTAGEVFRKVSPSVVVIRARGRSITRTGVERFLETGSGVLISADGKIMTAAHVVHSMDEIEVEFLGGDTVPARIVASEPAADLSLLELDKVPNGARPAVMANSDSVQVGDPVFVVGAPYGLSYSLSTGIISARWAPNTIYRTMPLAEFFQTTATINTGNSGGPMFNAAAQIIGIVSHNISKSGGSEGLGFVVTLNTARQLLLEKKSFWSGLEGQFLSDDMADLLNLPPNATGYLVKSVAKGSPAETMGMRGGTKVAIIDGQEWVLGGDIVLEAYGLMVKAANALKIREEMARLKSGDPMRAKVLRSGQVIELMGTAP